MVVGFALVAAWEIVTAAGVVGFRKPIYNALSLVANMLGLAVLFLMLNAVNLAFATMSRYLNSLDGVVFAFLVITVAAAEVVVGIAIIVQVYRAGREMDVDELDLMKE